MLIATDAATQELLVRILLVVHISFRVYTLAPEAFQKLPMSRTHGITGMLQQHLALCRASGACPLPLHPNSGQKHRADAPT